MWRGELDSRIYPDGTGDQRPVKSGYHTVEVGNADLAQDLREQFDVPKPVQVDLATTIVPVVSVDLTDEAGTESSEHTWFASTSRTPAAGNFAVSTIANVGSGIIVVDRLRVAHANEVRMTSVIQGINASAAGELYFLSSTPSPSGLSVEDEQSGGGITNPYVRVRLLGEDAGDPTVIELGLVLHPGQAVSVYGTSAATALHAQWWGREYEA